MANTTIEIKYSQVSGNTPSSLANGEISINTADGKLFYKSASGTITPFLKYPGPAGLNGEIQFNDSGVLGSTANISITKANGTVTFGSTVKAAGANGESAFISNGTNNRGGAGYHGFLEVNNTTATNGAKSFRINSTGGMEIINSGYSAIIMSLSNAGDLLASGVVQTGNYIQFADGTRQYTANAVASGAVTSVAGATGVVSNTQLINAVTSTNQITFNSIVTSNNGQGTNFRVGDDAWIGDVNVADTIRLSGLQNSANAWLRFGSTGTEALGRAGAGALQWGANTVWHSGNGGTGSGLDADLLDGLNSTSFANAAFAQAGFSAANSAQSTAGSAAATANGAVGAAANAQQSANAADAKASLAYNAANNATSNGFGVISVTGGGQLVAATPNTILNITAGSGISITTNNTSKTITLAAAATATGTFVDGADFAKVSETVGITNDLGGVSESASITINLGSLNITGILTPSTLIAPSYNAGSLPSATRAAQIAFVPDDTGGAIMVFSDGTNWRRFTDRTIIV
jgi:hypothetical protein